MEEVNNKKEVSGAKENATTKQITNVKTHSSTVREYVARDLKTMNTFIQKMQAAMEKLIDCQRCQRWDVPAHRPLAVIRSKYIARLLRDGLPVISPADYLEPFFDKCKICSLPEKVCKCAFQCFDCKEDFDDVGQLDRYMAIHDRKSAKSLLLMTPSRSVLRPKSRYSKNSRRSPNTLGTASKSVKFSSMRKVKRYSVSFKRTPTKTPSLFSARKKRISVSCIATKTSASQRKKYELIAAQIRSMPSASTPTKIPTPKSQGKSLRRRTLFQPVSRKSDAANLSECGTSEHEGTQYLDETYDEAATTGPEMLIKLQIVPCTDQMHTESFNAIFDQSASKQSYEYLDESQITQITDENTVIEKSNETNASSAVCSSINDDFAVEILDLTTQTNESMAFEANNKSGGDENDFVSPIKVSGGESTITASQQIEYDEESKEKKLEASILTESNEAIVNEIQPIMNVKHSEPKIDNESYELGTSNAVETDKVIEKLSDSEEHCNEINQTGGNTTLEPNLTGEMEKTYSENILFENVEQSSKEETSVIEPAETKRCENEEIHDESVIGGEQIKNCNEKVEINVTNHPAENQLEINEENSLAPEVQPFENTESKGEIFNESIGESNSNDQNVNEKRLSGSQSQNYAESIGTVDWNGIEGTTEKLEKQLDDYVPENINENRFAEVSEAIEGEKHETPTEQLADEIRTPKPITRINELLEMCDKESKRIAKIIALIDRGNESPISAINENFSSCSSSTDESSFNATVIESNEVKNLNVSKQTTCENIDEETLECSQIENVTDNDDLKTTGSHEEQQMDENDEGGTFANEIADLMAIELNSSSEEETVSVEGVRTFERNVANRSNQSQIENTFESINSLNTTVEIDQHIRQEWDDIIEANGWETPSKVRQITINTEISSDDTAHQIENGEIEEPNPNESKQGEHLNGEIEQAIYNGLNDCSYDDNFISAMNSSVLLSPVSMSSDTAFEFESKNDETAAEDQAVVTTANQATSENGQSSEQSKNIKAGEPETKNVERKMCKKRLKLNSKKRVLMQATKPFFECDACTKQFSCIQNLQKHFVVHAFVKISNAGEVMEELTPQPIEFGQDEESTRPLPTTNCLEGSENEQPVVDDIPESNATNNQVIETEEPSKVSKRRAKKPKRTFEAPVTDYQYPCKHCPMTFTRQKSLDGHIKSCKNAISVNQIQILRQQTNAIQPAKSSGSQLSSNTRRKSILKPRSIINGGAMPFKCLWADCKKTFKSKQHLKTHLFAHTEKEFACDNCDRQFSHKSSHKRHVEKRVCQK